MPEHLSNALKKTAFIMISFLLLPTFSAHAGEDFEAGLEEGRRHGAEILSRHSGALRPSTATPEAVPGYGAQTQQGLRSRGFAVDGGSRGDEDRGRRLDTGRGPVHFRRPGVFETKLRPKTLIHDRPRNGPHDPELQGGDREPYPSMRKKRNMYRVRQ